MSIRFSLQEINEKKRVINRMTSLPVKFEEEELKDLERKYAFVKVRFKKMSGSEKYINKEKFERNIGLIGLHNFSGFSARLFNSFDMDQDGKVPFFIGVD